MVRTGAFGYLQYGFEKPATFGTEALSLCTVFGLEQKITSWSFTNNRNVLQKLDQLEPDIYYYGTTRGSLGVDFVLSNPWWLNSLYDTVVTTDDSPTCCVNSHVYTNVSKIRQPISVEIGTHQAGVLMCCPTGVIRKLTGGVVNSVSLRSAIGEPVRGSVDISYADEEEACVCLDTTPASDTCNFPYTFAYGNLTTLAGTLANLQSFDITISTNSDLLYTHNTSVACNAYRRLFEITGSFTATYVDNEMLRHIYAQAHTGTVANTTRGLDCEVFFREPNDECCACVTATLTLVFDNGQAGANEKSITLTGTGVGFADHSVSLEPNEPIFETLNWQVRTLAPTAINQTACAARPKCT